jgi:hypothetical protein
VCRADILDGAGEVGPRQQFDQENDDAKAQPEAYWYQYPEQWVEADSHDHTVGDVDPCLGIELPLLNLAFIAETP